MELQVSILVGNGLVVTLDAEGSVLPEGHVVVDGPTIAAVGSTPPPDFRGEVLDATGAIVLPGLLNAHTHSPETLARGRADRLSYAEWLPRIWSSLDALTPAQIRVAVLLGCAEMLRSGTTAVVDHFRQTPLSVESVRAAIDAYREAGMRSAVAVMLRDTQMPPWARGNGVDPMSVCRAALEECDGDDRVSVMLAPSAPQRCTEGLLRAVAAMSDERGLFVQMHIDETRSQRDEAMELYGCSSIAHLERIGLLNERVSLAHCVWIDSADMHLLAHAGATVVHNPASNLRLASGIAPVPEMIERGIAIALGTDGAASNDGQSIPEAMKLASLLPGARGTPVSRPTAHDILAMVAGDVGGRFGLAGAGRIAAGSKADLVVVERADARLHPLNDVHWQLVLAGVGLRVRHVVVEGRAVLRDGEVQSFDEERLLAEADAVRLPY